jgi:transposase
MEAGYDGFWVHRFLVGHGVDSRVVDPASVPVDRRARRVKTDRSDAQSGPTRHSCHDMQSSAQAIGA